MNDKISPTTSAKCGKAKTNQQANFSTSNESQRQRILEWLQRDSLTTLQAREHLDIMHPAGRVKELRDKHGHNIITHWTIEHTDKGKHRVGRYVLLMEADDD